MKRAYLPRSQPLEPLPRHDHPSISYLSWEGRVVATIFHSAGSDPSAALEAARYRVALEDEVDGLG